MRGELTIAVREETRPAARAAHAAEVGAQLKRELRGEVRADAYTRHLFATDASLYAREPLVVGFPRDARDVAAAIEVAAGFELPVVTRGAGTSLSGQTTGQGIVLDTSRHMHAIHELDPQTLRARVGPGWSRRTSTARRSLSDWGSGRTPPPSTGPRSAA